VYGTLCDVEVLGADLAGVPLLLPVEGVGDLGPEPGRVVDGPLVHLSVLFRGGYERVGGELRAGEDEVVLLVGERLPEHDGVDPGDLAGAGGQLGHGLHVAELVGAGGASRLVRGGGATHGWPRRHRRGGGRR